MASSGISGGWSPYLTLLRNNRSGGVKEAGIFGKDGMTWATDITPRSGEVKAVVAGLANTSLFMASGIVFAGVKYMYVSARSSGGVIGRKGVNSILIRSTYTSVLVVTTNAGVNPATISSLDAVAEDLIKKRF